MTDETFAAIVGGAVGAVAGSLTGPVCAVLMEGWRRRREVQALRATLREHFLSAVGVIAQKRESAHGMLAMIANGGAPNGSNVPFPVEAMRRVDLALAEDLSVRERHVVTNVIELLVISDACIGAGLALTGNEQGDARLAATLRVKHAVSTLDSAEDLVTKWLRHEVPDVTQRDETVVRFPG